MISPYVGMWNNPVLLIDPFGADTTITGSITAQNEIIDEKGVPDFVPTGVKLESTANISATIVDGKFESVRAKIESVEFESDVLWGLSPEFTKSSLNLMKISQDKLTATIRYDVQTQLSRFEVAGQWLFTLLLDKTWQTNIITVTQSVEIELKIGSISTTFDGSTFPEVNYTGKYSISGSDNHEIQKTTIQATLKQSSYYNAVKADKFREKGHDLKVTKKITF